MANSWELAYATFHPWGDNDGDGWTNLEEYLNKTNPIVANDPMAEVESQVDGALY